MARSPSSAVTSAASRVAASVRASRERAGEVAESAAQVVALGTELLDPVIGVVEVGQPRRRALGPGQDLVDRLAVLAGEGGQRRPSLGDGGEPDRVALHPGGVRRDVGGDVGQQVGDLGQPVGQLGGLGVVLADALEQGACGRGGGQGVGLLPVRGQGLPGLLGRGAEGVGEPEPGLLPRQRLVLARLGADRLDLGEPEPQLVGLPGPVPGRRDHLGELGLGRGEAVVEVGVLREQAGDVVAAEPVQRLALCPRLEQPVLVGLSVDGDEGFGELGEDRDRDRGAADEGPRAALGGDVAGQDDAVVLDLATGVLHRAGEVVGRRRPDDALDPGGPRAGAHRAAVGAATQDQAEGGDEHGLAGTGLTGDDGQARAELAGSRNR